MRIRTVTNSGATIPELLVTALIVGTFFASIFEVNAVCLRMVSASKDNVAAIQGVQDRLETLRNLAFSELTAPTYLRDTVMLTPSNTSDLAQRVVEEVTITAYDADTATGGTTGSGLKLRRAAGATVTPTIVGTPDPTLASAKAVMVNVKYTWNMSLGGRSRVEETTSIVSAGIKK